MKDNNCFTIEQNGEMIKVGKRIIKTKKVCLCNWCQHPYIQDKMVNCNGKGCELILCKSCHTKIEGLPFCHECTADIIKNNTLLIITKGELPIDTRPKGLQSQDKNDAP